MDANPNVLISQEPFKKAKFKIPLKLIILISLIVLVLIAAYLLLNIKNSPNQPEKKQKQIETTSHQEAAITTFKIGPNQIATYLHTTTTTLPIPSSLDNPPNEATSSSFIFKSEVISAEGQVYYSSWKSFPILEKTNNSFEIKVLTPYQKGAILKLTDTKNKTIITTVF